MFMVLDLKQRGLSFDLENLLNEENIKRINNANKTLVQTNKQLYFK